eukprot:1536070-Alexandrium_andersonii.AAC.1
MATGSPLCLCECPPCPRLTTAPWTAPALLTSNLGAPLGTAATRSREPGAAAPPAGHPSPL